MKTRITELLGIDKPLILPGMSWIATPELVAAVCNAGGLGILATGPLDAAATASAIDQIRSLTDKPFGVGCTLMMPGAAENTEVALKKQVPVINYSLGKGDKLTAACHAYGGKVIATVTTKKHALSAVQSGADCLQVTGHEAAAHGGEVTSLVLVPSIRDVTDVPIIATGGFGDGRGLAAALCLGADAIAMGSRFATSSDSPLHENIKHNVVGKDQHDTIYSPNFDGIPARYMKTPTAIKLTKKPMNIVSTALRASRAAKMVKQPVGKVLAGMLVQLDKVKMLAYFGAALPRLQSATTDGDLQYGMQFIGQTQGLINDIASVAEICERTVASAEQILQHLGQGSFIANQLKTV